MKKAMYTGLIMIMTAMILLTTVPFSRAEEKPVNRPDAAVSDLTKQFDYSRQPPESVVSSPANADQLGKEIIVNRIDKNFLIICFLLFSMLFSLFTLIYFIRKGPHCADDIVHASGLVLIIFGTILIVLVADTEQQLTASIGIIGAIAGYLFGTMSRTKDARQEKTKEDLKGATNE